MPRVLPDQGPRSALAALALAVAAPLAAPLAAHGQITAANAPAALGLPANANNPCDAWQYFTWGPLAPGNAAYPAGPWSAALTAANDPAGGGILLTATPRHSQGANGKTWCHKDEAPNLGKSLSMLLANPGDNDVDMRMRPHGNHLDDFALGAKRPGPGAAMGDMGLSAQHIAPKQKRIEVSFDGPAGPLAAVAVTPFYRESGGGILAGSTVDYTGVPGGMDLILGALPSVSPTDGELVGYRTTVNGTYDTTVGFFGEEDDVPGVVSLIGGFAAADVFRVVNALFDPTNPAFPLFGAAGGGTPLFAGINLTQYFAHLASAVHLGDPFTFTGGTASGLPGVTLGTTDVTFGVTGFETANRYSGGASVAALGDSHLSSVPEPAGLALLGTGVAALGAGARRRGRGRPRQG